MIIDNLQCDHEFVIIDTAKLHCVSYSISVSGKELVFEIIALFCGESQFSVDQELTIRDFRLSLVYNDVSCMFKDSRVAVYTTGCDAFCTCWREVDGTCTVFEWNCKVE